MAEQESEQESEQRYEWATRTTWREASGGGHEDDPYPTEEDARLEIEAWRRRVADGRRTMIQDIKLIRRPIGEWEEVEL